MRNRREALKVLGGLVLASPVLAQMGHGDQGMGAAPAKGALVPPKPIPWEAGSCAFCNMPLKTPEAVAGAHLPPGVL